jgi:hypothetical protein
MSNLKQAIEYLGNGYHVIPIRHDKRPYIKWETYQHDIPMQDEVEDWWAKWPDANIGIITGEVTDLVVIDADGQEGIESIQRYAPELKPFTESPHGLHYWFKYHPGLVNKARLIDGIDIRTDGGYIIAPPGRNENGGTYRKGTGGKYDLIPLDLYSVLKNSLNNLSCIKDINIANLMPGENATGSFETPQNNPKSHKTPQIFIKGTRDEDLFRLANHLIKGGMDIETACNYLIFCAQRCEPPFPEYELKIKIESAIKRAEKRERNIAQEVREYVKATEGIFRVRECHFELQNATKDEKKAARAEILRLASEGIIEKHGDKNGVYRKKAEEAEKIDIFNLDRTSLEIWYPLDLHSYFRTMPKNLIIFAGTPDSGKTALLMRTAIMNVNKGLKVRYMSSEMGACEFADRANQFMDVGYHEWSNVDIRSVSSNYKDHILPNDINIIDYLEITDSFYLVGEEMKGIYDALGNGIAIIGLQKDWKTPLGRGGSFSIEKPRLYVTLTSNPPDGNIAKIEKMKNWKTETSMNGKECNFKIRGGNQINRVTEWDYVNRGTK